MSETTIETNGIILRHQGNAVQIHRDEHDQAWTFRIDNPTFYRDTVPTYGYNPRFTEMQDAIDAATRYLTYLRDFLNTVETAQDAFKAKLNEFPVINNIERPKRAHEAVNG